MLVARRIIESAGIFGLYAAIEKRINYNLFTIDDEHSKNLIKFRKNIAEEAAQLLEKINNNLYSELEKIHKQAKTQKSISEWVTDTLGNDGVIPPKLRSAEDRSRTINDELRVVPIKQMDKVIRLAKHSEIHRNPETALTYLLNEFYTLENEMIVSFTVKQKQVSKIIESYRTKAFVTCEPYFPSGIYQVIACFGFSFAMRIIWPISPAQLVVHEKKLPKYSKLLFPLLLAVAYYVSGDEKEVNDYSLDYAYASVDLPPPDFPRLPLNQFAGIAPVIYRPGQTPEDRYNLKYIEELFNSALCDGFIFRHVMFESLLRYSSARTSHLLTAYVATVAAAMKEITEETYYTVGGDDNSSSNKSLQVSEDLSQDISMAVVLKPLLLQAVLFITGRFYLTIVVDMLMHLKEVKQQVVDDDNFWVLFRTTDTYKLACEVTAMMDRAVYPVSQMYDTLVGMNSYHALSHKIAKRYIKNQKGLQSEQQYLTVEDVVTLEKAMIFASKSFHIPMRDMLPRPYDPSISQQGNSAAAEDSEILRSISGIDNDSLARIQAFIEDTERLTINKYFDGKVDVALAHRFLSPCIDNKAGKKKVDYDDEAIQEVFMKRVCFWDEEASEELVLDLVQGLYEFLLSKRLIYAEEYLYVQGRAHMMEIECELVIHDKHMTEYYAGLEKWLQHATQLEEINYLNRYGLTKSHFQAIVSRRASTAELNSTWESYLLAQEYRSKIRGKADPIPIYRSH